MNNLIITNQGKALTAKLIAGTSTAKYTKICTSDYDYTETNVEELLSLYQVKQTTLVSKVERTDLTLVEVLGAVNNSDLQEGYYVRGIGLYAEDADQNEILFAVSTSDHPDYMPAFGGKTVSGISFRLNVKVDNADQVLITVNPAATPTIDQLNDVAASVEGHLAESINSVSGMHGFRYFNDTLQFNDGNGNWVDIETSGGGIAPDNVSGASVKVGNGRLTLKWSDPDDTVVDGQTISTWKGTRLIQKAGTYPENGKDGTILLDNRIRDAYSVNGFEINGLTNGITYYFRLIPYSDQKAENLNDVNCISGSPQPYKVMGINIDLSNSNPDTCVTYTDDAAGMTAGSAAWDEFFGHKPCLFKNGEVVGYLNPDNFAQFEDGSAADITSGAAGDVMIEFPRRGLIIVTSGNTLSIKMIEDPDSPNFKYYAHQRGESNRNAFYVGAYEGYVDGNLLRSLSEKMATDNKAMGYFRTCAQNNGHGYEQSGFYQLTYRQCMFVLKYKSLNSQEAIGMGYFGGSVSGKANEYGMDCEIIKKTNPQYLLTSNYPIKCLGIENFWGSNSEYVDGFYIADDFSVMTATTDFNDEAAGYKNQGIRVGTEIRSYITQPMGDTETGFVIKAGGGSGTTFFCDYADLRAASFLSSGGASGNTTGIFYVNIVSKPGSSGSTFGARLMYL